MQSRSRKERHGAYRVERLIRTDEIDGRTRLGQRVRDARLAYAVAYGYATWESVPKPLQTVIKQAVRLELFAERLFHGFWSGSEPPKRFDTVSENLRRVLNDMGLEPSRAASPDVAALLAGMPGREARR
jgi:hypothetical protein